jgi:hypothetical protein
MNSLLYNIPFSRFIPFVINSRGTFSGKRPNLYTISKLLGHKDIRTSERYADHCTESLRRGVETLEKEVIKSITAAHLEVPEGRALM